MSIQFNEATNNTGICQQARVLAGVDSTQWPIARVVNSANNWHDFVVGYAIGADRRFQWDDTNHTKLPEGTMDLVAGSSDYAYTADEQGNSIVTLIGASLVDSSGKEWPLQLVDRNDPSYDLASYGKVSGTPTRYDKIADNVVRLDARPTASDVSQYDLKLYFQRTGSYFAASDTTKAPGVSPLLHRGYVIAAAYDIALTLGLKNLQALSVERQREEQRVVQYFSERSQDERKRMTMAKALYI